MTRIEWTDQTWNPIRGCTRVSEGCRHCYAERQAARFAGPGQPFDGYVTGSGAGARWTGRVELVEAKLYEPLGWRRPRRVFVNSMSDLFHESLPDECIDRVFAVMALAPQHTFQVLTKRHERMREYMSGDRYGVVNAAVEIVSDARGDVAGLVQRENMDATGLWPLPNVWLGMSVEDQPTADERMPVLSATPAAVRYVSAEPLLGPVDLRPWLVATPRLDWVIVGGESGPGARPMHPDWVRSLRDQCAEAGVPFFFKQWGEFSPAGPPDRPGWGEWLDADLMSGHAQLVGPRTRPATRILGRRLIPMWRVGKKRAGRLLDGVEHNGSPPLGHA